MLEELFGRDEVRQAGEELGHVDEVHGGQDVLVEAQQAQRRAEQELLAIPAEDVPHAARQVQRQGLAVEGEDPGGEVVGGGEVPLMSFQKKGGRLCISSEQCDNVWN